MIISDKAIKNKISVLVLAVIIVIMGIQAYMSLPRESEPDITIPNVFISTSYKGVSAADIEISITTKIEKKLKGLEGVKKVHSISSEGSSSISIEFLPGTDIDDALQKVKDKVDEAKNDLPVDLEEDPVVFEINIAEIPIVVFSISGTCSKQRLKKIAERLEENFEAVPGVLEAEISGMIEREIRIEVDPDKLSYYKIPITKFEEVLKSENQNISGGSIILGDGEYTISVPGEFKTAEGLLDVVIGSYNENPVYIRNVAIVIDGFKRMKNISRLNGVDALGIGVKKRVGANIIEITDKINEIIEKDKLTWPEGTKITKLMDQAKQVRLMISDLENNILSGLILVSLVLLFALGLRNAVLVGIAIPFSMFLSFFILQSIGITLNVVVLFSLTLALGMLVDNAIVIVENIYRYMQQGVPRVKAAIKGTSEVASPVIGSTFTTLAAFFPLIFWTGIMGEFMKYLPITLIITLSSSLFVALIINPALASIFVKLKKQHVLDLNTVPDDIETGEKPVEIKGKILTAYAGLLKSALKHRVLVLCISFAFLIFFYQLWSFFVGLEKSVALFPSLDPKQAYVNIKPPEGADIDAVDKLVRRVAIAVSGVDDSDPNISFNDLYDKAYRLQEHKMTGGRTFMGPTDLDNIEHIYDSSDKSGSVAVESFGAYLPNHLGVQLIDLKDKLRPGNETLNEMRRRVSRIPGAEITIKKAEDGPPTGDPINIEISGNNFKELGRIAKEIKEIIADVPFIKNISDDYVAGLPCIRISVDRQKAAILGLSTGMIGNALKTVYNGLDISTFHEHDDDYDITLTFGLDDRKSADILRKIMIPSPLGQLIPLTTVAKIDYSGNMGNIVRVNYERVITVSAGVDETKIPGAVARTKAEELLKDFHLPPGYNMKFTGEFEFQKESEEFLAKAFTAAIFLIFFILVTIFNSVSQPLIILSSVILSLGGVFLGLLVTDSPFIIIMTGVGIISLAGVVVNNAIVLIDYTNKLIQRGMNSYEAIIAAGATRLRPVLLTAITTILGLLPMVTGVSFDFHNFSMSWVSESTQWWENMASVVIFGLIIATFLTLVVVPSFYSLLLSMRNSSGVFVKKLSKKNSTSIPD